MKKKTKVPLISPLPPPQGRKGQFFFYFVHSLRLPCDPHLACKIRKSETSVTLISSFFFSSFFSLCREGGGKGGGRESAFSFVLCSITLSRWLVLKTSLNFSHPLPPRERRDNSLSPFPCSFFFPLLTSRLSLLSSLEGRKGKKILLRGDALQHHALSRSVCSWYASQAPKIWSGRARVAMSDF